MSNTAATASTADGFSNRLGKAVPGVLRKVGTGFTAHRFSSEAFGPGMDPLLMVEHFVMTAPTFQPHLHTGISAVTVMFEDSEGTFLNRDTLGRNTPLRAGDLYWLAAAGGAAHEERPEDGARAHALQVFVDLPDSLKNGLARAHYVRAQDVPVLEGPGHRVRVVLGRSADAVGAAAIAQEMTMLDGFLEQGASFAHGLPEGRQAWIYAVAGELTIRCQDDKRRLHAGSAVSVGAGSQAQLVLDAEAPTHFVLMAARPVRRPFAGSKPPAMPVAADPVPA